jgi:hypothetical protein
LTNGHHVEDHGARLVRAVAQARHQSEDRQSQQRLASERLSRASPKAELSSRINGLANWRAKRRHQVVGGGGGRVLDPCFASCSAAWRVESPGIRSSDGGDSAPSAPVTS